MNSEIQIRDRQHFVHFRGALAGLCVTGLILFTGGSAAAQAGGSSDGPVVSSETTSAEQHYYVRPLPEPMGFAFANEPTTGGEGGVEVTVTTAEQLLRYASSDDPYIINVVDTIEIVRGLGFPETYGEYNIGSNTTIRGVGPNATIMYGGFLISEVENVIIQNLNFDGTYEGFDSNLYSDTECSDVPAGRHRYKNGPCLSPGQKGPTDNAIEITNSAERIWITQNSFRRYSDEVMSVKLFASYVTISWNRFDDLISGQNGMMILIGSGDGRIGNIGRLRTTLHHNYMASRSRHPRVRFGIIHIFNNYYHDVGSYGIATTENAEILVENNFFENVNNPWHIGYGSSREGYLVEQNNIFENTNPGRTRGELGEEVTRPSDFYDYTLNAPGDVPTLVLEGSGAAGAGDFSDQIMPVPALTELGRPAGESNISLNPVFEWSDARFAESYRIQIKEGVSDDLPAILDTVITGTTFEYGSGLPELEGNRTYFWRVRTMTDDADGAWSRFSYFVTEAVTVDAGNEQRTIPDAFVLESNYPNPFNPSTNIRYEMPVAAHVTLDVYDITGRLVTTLVNDNRQEGRHTVTFDAETYQLSSGIYMYRIVATPVSGSRGQIFMETRKMNLIK